MFAAIGVAALLASACSDKGRMIGLPVQETGRTVPTTVGPLPSGITAGGGAQCQEAKIGVDYTVQVALHDFLDAAPGTPNRFVMLDIDVTSAGQVHHATLGRIGRGFDPLRVYRLPDVLSEAQGGFGISGVSYPVPLEISTAALRRDGTARVRPGEVQPALALRLPAPPTGCLITLTTGYSSDQQEVPVTLTP